MKKTLISALQLEQLKAILAGHMHHFFEERFSPTAIQYTVGATFDGDVQVIHFI